MMYFEKITRFLRWITNKAPEAIELSSRDIILGKLVMRITKEAIGKEMRPLPLDKLRQIHPVGRQTALQKTRERIDVLQKHKDKILQSRHVTFELQEKIMPSITPIRAVSYNGVFMVFEGNGRIVALQEVFADHKDILIDVEIFTLKKDSSVPNDILRLRKKYGLE